MKNRATRAITTLGTVTALLAVAMGLGACKSKASSRCNTCVAPSPCAVGSPGVAAVPQDGFPQTEYPSEFAAGDYPPPPPPMTTDPVPSARQAELDAVRDEAELARQRSQDLERQLLAERRSLEQTQDALRAMEGRIADLETPPAGPAPTPDMSCPPVGGSSDAATRLMDELRARSVADVMREGDMVVVRCTNSFKAGSDKLKADVQLMTTLNATADALSRHNGASVAVVGHSDGDPIRKSSWTDNDALSLARAQRVAQVLADNGVDQNRISIDGRGFREPLVTPEVGRADKARNRRVEIMIRP